MGKFCIYCGKELSEEARFCISCGAEVIKDVKEAEKECEKKEYDDDSAWEETEDNYREPRDKRTKYERDIITEKIKAFWNSEQFGWWAIKFNRILYYIDAVIGIILLIWAIQGGSFLWGIVALSCIASGVLPIKEVRAKKRSKLYTRCISCQQEVKIGTQFCPTCGIIIPVRTIEPEDLETAAREGYETNPSKSSPLQDKIWGKGPLERKKRGLVARVVIGIIIIVVISSSNFWGPIANTKNMSFSAYGSETLGEAFDDSFSGADWSYEKIDSNSGRVFVKGYMKDLGEDVQVEFSYEEFGDACYVEVVSVTLLDSGKRYTDDWNILIFMNRVFS